MLTFLKEIKDKSENILWNRNYEKGYNTFEKELNRTSRNYICVCVYIYMYIYLILKTQCTNLEMETAENRITKLEEITEEIKKNEAHRDKKMKIWKRN